MDGLRSSLAAYNEANRDLILADIPRAGVSVPRHTPGGFSTGPGEGGLQPAPALLTGPDLPSLARGASPFPIGDPQVGMLTAYSSRSMLLLFAWG